MMEDNMANALKGLTFTAMPQVVVNPVVDRRNRIIVRLEEQKALLANPNSKRKIKVREKNAAGVKELVEKQQKVLPWWRGAANGSYAFGIRAGKQVEFEKGKTAVIVASIDKLPGVIDALIGAVRNGELDAQLEAASKGVGPRKQKKAA
jgi:hypothetical protein